jgi:hypothetical protein
VKKGQDYVILEPFQIQQQFWVISPLWKQYLDRHQPESRLYLCGMFRYAPYDYIDLFDDCRLSSLASRSSHAYLAFPQLDIRRKLRPFFEPHGKTGLFDTLIRLTQKLNASYYALFMDNMELARVREEILDHSIIQDWQNFHARWKTYSPYFRWLPFYPQILSLQAGIDSLAAAIGQVHTDPLHFLQTNPHGRLQGGIDSLRNIDEEYQLSRFTG